VAKATAVANSIGSTSVECRNCHRKLSDSQKDHPPKIGETPSLPERVGHFLLGLADFFLLLAEQLRQFGLLGWG